METAHCLKLCSGLLEIVERWLAFGFVASPLQQDVPHILHLGRREPQSS
jgi:hypothetical protein